MTERSSAESNEPSLLNLEGEEFSLSFDTPELNLSFDIEEPQRTEGAEKFR